MTTKNLNIGTVPAIVYGDTSRKAYLYVHGKNGVKEDAATFAELAVPMGYQVVSIDLPGHGAQKQNGEELLPWEAVPQIQSVYEELQKQYASISLYAVSIGAWLSMIALQEKPVAHALFVSPVVYMEDLINNIMLWAGVSETRLRQESSLPTGLGETLSWEYLSWVRSHSYLWKIPTDILYGQNDSLTPFESIRLFSTKPRRTLSIMPEGEHWFHTPEQLVFKANWEKNHL